MKAILVNKKDRSLHWSEVPDPIMGDENVLVKIEAAHDILYRGENVGKVVLTVD